MAYNDSHLDGYDTFSNAFDRYFKEAYRDSVANEVRDDIQIINKTLSCNRITEEDTFKSPKNKITQWDLINYQRF